MSARYRAIAHIYHTTNVNSAALSNDPHHLVRLMLDGFLERVRSAAYAISRRDIATKAKKIASAGAILSYLRGILDMDRGDTVAMQLDSLYDYCLRRLSHANAQNDVAALDEIVFLMEQISTAWQELPQANQHS